MNRSDDMLYTLLVPDRCRTLMPCFDQPDIKARFKLTLKIPSRWRAVANGEPIRTEYFSDYKLYEFEETKTVEYLSVCFYRGEVLVRGTLRGRTMDRYLSPGDGHFED